MPTIRAAIVPVTAFQQNCAIVFEEATKKAVVVDPGGDADLIREAVAKLGVTVEAVWLTHGHLDHVGAAQEIAATYGVEIVGPHAADAEMMANVPAIARSYGLDGLKAAKSDRLLAEGDQVKVGAVVFDVLHCPGHSPGSVVFVDKANRFAIVGDVLFQGSIGRTDFPNCDHQALIDSITHKLLPLGDDIGFVCGHGPGSTFGREKATNPFLRS